MWQLPLQGSHRTPKPTLVVGRRVIQVREMQTPRFMLIFSSWTLSAQQKSNQLLPQASFIFWL